VIKYLIVLFETRSNKSNHPFLVCFIKEKGNKQKKSPLYKSKNVYFSNSKKAESYIFISSKSEQMKMSVSYLPIIHTWKSFFRRQDEFNRRYLSV